MEQKESSRRSNPNLRTGRRNLSEVRLRKYDFPLAHDLNHSNPDRWETYFPRDEWKIVCEQYPGLRLVTDDVRILSPFYASPLRRSMIPGFPKYQSASKQQGFVPEGRVIHQVGHSIFITPDGEDYFIFDVHGKSVDDEYPEARGKQSLLLQLECPLYLTFGVRNNDLVTYIPNTRHCINKEGKETCQWMDPFWETEEIDPNVAKIILRSSARLRKGNATELRPTGGAYWRGTSNLDGDPKSDYWIAARWEEALVIFKDSSEPKRYFIGQDSEDDVIPEAPFILWSNPRTDILVSNLFVPTQDEINLFKGQESEELPF